MKTFLSVIALAVAFLFAAPAKACPVVASYHAASECYGSAALAVPVYHQAAVQAYAAPVVVRQRVAFNGYGGAAFVQPSYGFTSRAVFRSGFHGGFFRSPFGFRSGLSIRTRGFSLGPFR